MLAEREKTVFDWCRGRGLPIALVPAGGYTRTELDKTELVGLHSLTLEQAASTAFARTAYRGFIEIQPMIPSVLKRVLKIVTRPNRPRRPRRDPRWLHVFERTGQDKEAWERYWDSQLQLRRRRREE